MTDTSLTPVNRLPVRAIRRRADGLFACVDDAGEVTFGHLGAATLTFEDQGDNEALYAAMSACPGGHEAVEEYELSLSLEPR